MTSWTPKRRAAFAAGCVLVVALAALWLRPGGEPAPAARPVAAPAAQPPRAPYQSRQDFPVLREPPAPAPAAPVVLATPPPPPAEIPLGGGAPPPPPQTATGWVNDLRDATCACKTRTCVQDLQGEFVRRIGGMTYSEERDGEAYGRAAREAMRCFAALPEDS